MLMAVENNYSLLLISLTSYKYFGSFQGSVPHKNTYLKHSIFMPDDGP